MPAPRIEECPWRCGFRDLPEYVREHIREEHETLRFWSFNDWLDFYENLQGLGRKEAEQEARQRLLEQENREHLTR